MKQQPKNPTTIALPRALPIAKAQRSAFQMYASNLLASLKLYESGYHIASTKRAALQTG